MKDNCEGLLGQVDENRKRRPTPRLERVSKESVNSIVACSQSTVLCVQKGVTDSVDPTYSFHQKIACGAPKNASSPCLTLVAGAARPESATRLVSIIPVSYPSAMRGCRLPRVLQGQDGLGRVWESEFRAENKGGP